MIAKPTISNSQSNRARDYVSASRLNLWLKCPLAFKLRYVDGVPPLTTPGLFVGKQTHLALETWYGHRQAGAAISVDDLLSRLAHCWSEQAAAAQVRFDDTQQERACQAQVVALVRTYLRQFAAHEARPLAVEATLQAPLIDAQSGEDLGIPLVGVLDLVLPERQGATIIDFKTAARSGDPLSVLHEIQLTSYAYLFRQQFHKHEASLEIRNLIKTKTPKIECQPHASRDAIHFRRLFTVIRNYLDSLDRGRFTIRPGLGCLSCEHAESRCLTWPG